MFIKNKNDGGLTTTKRVRKGGMVMKAKVAANPAEVFHEVILSKRSGPIKSYSVFV
jgi:hypothetical protein